MCCYVRLGRPRIAVLHSRLTCCTPCTHLLLAHLLVQVGATLEEPVELARLLRARGLADARAVADPLLHRQVELDLARVVRRVDVAAALLGDPAVLLAPEDDEVDVRLVPEPRLGAARVLVARLELLLRLEAALLLRLLLVLHHDLKHWQNKYNLAIEY